MHRNQCIGWRQSAPAATKSGKRRHLHMQQLQRPQQ
jgi:hypothetical protein